LKIISFVISVVKNGTGTLTAFSHLTSNFVARVMVVVPKPQNSVARFMVVVPNPQNFVARVMVVVPNPQHFVARVMVVVSNPQHFDYKSSFCNILVSSNGSTICHNYSQQRLEVIITRSVRPLFLFSVSPLDIFIHRSLSSDSPNFNNHRHTLNTLFQGLSGETWSISGETWSI
jgi:hypothetical protein